MLPDSRPHSLSAHQLVDLLAGLLVAGLLAAGLPVAGLLAN